MREDIEEYERVERMVAVGNIIASAVSVLLNIWVMISLLQDLLGINFGKIFHKIVKQGFRLPPNWVQQYQPFLTALQWILLVTIMVDMGMSYRFSVEGEPRVPDAYLRVVSFIAFFCGLWLFLAYHVVAYGVIFVAGFVTFMYSLFVGKEEEEELTEEEEKEFFEEG